MTTHESAETTGTADTGRRNFLRCAALVGAAGLGLAACGPDPAAEPTGPIAGDDGPVTVGKAADIPVGGGKVYADSKVVVVQPAAGQYKAYPAICPHQGALLGKVEQGVIHCPRHGSQFAMTDGSVIRRPATTGLKPIPMHIQDGDVIVGQ
jgi:nitrite reductase/ring-hydroxylating ferredoxin subunit